MQQLFPEEKQDFILFDSSRYRIIKGLNRKMNDAEAEKANQYFRQSLCPNLQYRKTGESRTKIYTVKR